jgi:hypothetical protein
MRVLVNGDTLRKLTPAFVVGGVVLASLLAQAPSLASNNDVGYGYGYGNNCGVKGDGMHDHGKVCPNRPFPGHGLGVLRILGTASPSNGSTGTNGTRGQGSPDATTNSATTSAETAPKSGKGHGNAHGRGNAHVHGVSGDA